MEDDRYYYDHGKRPVCICEICKQPVWPGDEVVSTEDGYEVHTDCYEDKMKDELVDWILANKYEAVEE